MKRQHRHRGWRFVVGALVTAALLTVVLRATVIDFHYIGSGSMENTLLPGDGIAVNRLAYANSGIQRGDVVIFDGRGSFLPYERSDALDGLLWALRLRGNDSVYVKRVIAVGGDTVDCCSADGKVRVNGKPIDEPYLYPGNAPSETPFAAVVPQGRIWVMGDHRAESADSRSLLGAPGGGMINTERVIGKVERIIWPLDRAASLEPGVR
ncbi:signal peptidase I [Paeniglutamicibacter cryotolerans]|uniref:signal peptidase I n=1 Tax=Paeniglutamicibacter cryotolerans TaxID=670079 RepID=UPI0028B0E7D4|nr:signal peptidase I [Paeniglutamicibacter cryotolerans]